jgi:hypothetical protein
MDAYNIQRFDLTKEKSFSEVLRPSGHIRVSWNTTAKQCTQSNVRIVSRFL